MNVSRLSEQIRALRASLEEVAANQDDERLDATGWSQLLAGLEDALSAAQAQIVRSQRQGTQARLELDDARARNRTLLEALPEAIVVTDLNGMIREANSAAANLFHIAPAFLLEQAVTSFVTIHERFAVRAALARCAQQLGVCEQDLRLAPRNGPAFPARAKIVVLRDAGGAATALVWSFRDDTLLKVAEDKLRSQDADLDRRVLQRTRQVESELLVREQMLVRAHAAYAGSEESGAKLAELVQDLDAIIWKADLDSGRFTFVSRYAEEVLGYPLARWLDDPDFWLSVIHPDDRAYAKAGRKKVQAGAAEFEAEYRLIAADGRTIWFRESVRVLTNESGGRRELRGLMVNVSRRKKIERHIYTAKRLLAERLEDESYLHELYERLAALPDWQGLMEEVLGAVLAVVGGERGALFLADAGGAGLTLGADAGLSAAFQGAITPWLAGAPPRILVSSELVTVADVTDDPAQARLAAAAGPCAFRGIMVCPLITRGGDRLGCVAAFFAEPHQPNERQTGLLDRYARQAAEALFRARRLAELADADRRKDQFLATLSHEMRTPLASLHAALELLDAADPEARAQSRAAIARQVHQLTLLVDDLLDTARVAHGKIELRKQHVDVAEAIRKAAETVRAAVAEHRHRLNLILPARPLIVNADSLRIEQILVNLLTNAAKYTEDGGQIDVSAWRADEHVAIRVKDDGIGIDAATLPRIFSFYSQAAPAAGRSGGGLGIGLALVRTLVEMHGGYIEAFSEGLGRGSEFVVTLPAHVPEEEEEPNAPPVSGNGLSTPMTRRVLVVDDHDDTARLLGRLLERDGHQVAVATDGVAALASAKSNAPHVALIDLGLPGMSGVALALRLRQEYPSVRLVAVTGQGREFLDRGKIDAFDGYLLKPVRLEDLAQLLPT